MDTNWLAKLKGLISPTSTAGTLGNQDLYNTYMQQAIENGGQPVSRMQFAQMLQQNPSLAKQLMGQAGGQGGGMPQGGRPGMPPMSGY
jgi:hypothetical protein